MFWEQEDDEAIGFLEDMADTYNELESKLKGNGDDWEQKYKRERQGMATEV